MTTDLFELLLELRPDNVKTSSELRAELFARAFGPDANERPTARDEASSSPGDDVAHVVALSTSRPTRRHRTAATLAVAIAIVAATGLAVMVRQHDNTASTVPPLASGLSGTDVAASSSSVSTGTPSPDAIPYPMLGTLPPGFVAQATSIVGVNGKDAEAPALLLGWRADADATTYVPILVTTGNIAADPAEQPFGKWPNAWIIRDAGATLVHVPVNSSGLTISVYGDGVPDTALQSLAQSLAGGVTALSFLGGTPPDGFTEFARQSGPSDVLIHGSSYAIADSSNATISVAAAEVFPVNGLSIEAGSTLQSVQIGGRPGVLIEGEYSPGVPSLTALYTDAAYASIIIVGHGITPDGFMTSAASVRPATAAEQAAFTVDPMAQAAIDASTAASSSLPPGVVLPDQLPVLDPSTVSEAPVRSDPIQRWLATQPDWPVTRWFIRYDSDGAPVGGISIESIVDTEWSKSFSAATPVTLDGAEGRMVARSIGWHLADGVLAVRGAGDVTTEEQIAVANIVIAKGASAIAAPDGFVEVPVPEALADVSYDTANIGLTVYRSAGGVQPSLADFALMTAGPAPSAEPLAKGDGYRLLYSGAQVTITRLDDGDILTLTSPLDRDPTALLAAVEFAPTAHITARAFYTLEVPPGATWQFGTIDFGRWAIAEFTDGAGETCRVLQAAFLDGQACPPPKRADCPIVSSSYGPTANLTLAVLPYASDTAELVLDGTTVSTKSQQSGTYTFLKAEAATMPMRVQVTVDGAPVCTNG